MAIEFKRVRIMPYSPDSMEVSGDTFQAAIALGRVDAIMPAPTYYGDWPDTAVAVFLNGTSDPLLVAGRVGDWVTQ